MKKIIKKILPHLPRVFTEYYEFLFSDPSENQLRVVKAKENKFKSYTELKKHQRRLKRFFIGTFLSLFFLLAGLVLQPILFPKQPESEIYIPNGRGDILLGNTSKNQTTVIFKTLDGANDNKPLATKAIVEAYRDQQYTKLERRTTEDDYAVTHIIPVDTLQEGKLYYIRIITRDAAVPEHTKIISSWGDGTDPITVFTSGELVANCANTGNIQNSNSTANVNESNKVTIASSGLNSAAQDSENDKTLGGDSALQISSINNENYLQPKNKVQTIISWNTNNPATSVLIYSEGNSKEEKEIAIDREMQTKHAVVLTTFKAGTIYYFKVKSVDRNGNSAISQQYSLKTPKPQTTFAEKIVESFDSILRQIKPQ